jgi:hypothetical protein
VNRTGSRVEQADKALAEPFKHAGRSKPPRWTRHALTSSLADAEKPEGPAQPELPAEVDPRMEDAPYPLRVSNGRTFAMYSAFARPVMQSRCSGS